MFSSSTAVPAEDDELLAAQARVGEKDAFRILVARYQGRVYRLAERISGNASDAEEITQETFLQAHRALAGFQAQSRFCTWLYRIAVNEALMRRRSARRRPTVSFEVLETHGLEAAEPHEGRSAGSTEPSPHADDVLDHRRLTERLRDALEELDIDARAALVLRYLEDRSAAEVAVLLGITPDAVRQRASRARRKLRSLMYS